MICLSFVSVLPRKENTIYSQGKDCNHHDIRYLFGLECRILNAGGAKQLVDSPEV